MNSPFSRIVVIAMLAATAVISFSFTNPKAEAHKLNNELIAPCPSGNLTANLTGWTLNNVIPRGIASYKESSKELKISLLSIKLDDGTSLTIETKKDKLGEVTALKDGKAEISLTVSDGLKEKDRIRVMEDDRPIVSGDLICAKAESSPTPAPAKTPTPAPSPEPSPSPRS